MLCPYTLDTMNSKKMILNVIAIGLQKMFYLETETIMQLNVVLRSYAAFSCKNESQLMYIYGLFISLQLLNDILT